MQPREDHGGDNHQRVDENETLDEVSKSHHDPTMPRDHVASVGCAAKAKPTARFRDVAVPDSGSP